MSFVDDMTKRSQAAWVNGTDRLRIKTESAVTSFQFRLTLRFIRSNQTNVIHTCSKIITPSADRGASAGKVASFPFGIEEGSTRTVNDAAITSGLQTLTSNTAVFAAGDVGKCVTIAGAGVPGIFGPGFITSLYQGQITAFTNSTTVTVTPAAGATVSGAELNIEPILRSDQDGGQLGDGYIIGCDAAFWQQLSRRGDVYMEAEINRGPWNMNGGMNLFSDYFTSHHHLSWPQTNYHHMVEGNGRVKTYVGTDPVPGVEVSYTIPANTRWRVQSIRLLLVTDATVANRFVQVRILDDSANIVWDTPSIAQTASLSTLYMAGPGSPTSPAIVNNRVTLNLPENFWMFQGWQITTLTTGLVAGDNFGAPVFSGEEYIEL